MKASWISSRDSKMAAAAATAAGQMYGRGQGSPRSLPPMQQHFCLPLGEVVRTA
jgi:hypothetical protein